MSYQRGAKQKIALRERRLQDRELARVERERQVRQEHRRRVALRAAAVVGVLAALAGAGLAVRAWVEAGRRGPANMASDGVLVVGDGTATHAQTSAPLPDDGTPTPSADLSAAGVTQVVAYLDYSDPQSAAFWTANGASITRQVTAARGRLSIEIHPVAPGDDPAAPGDATRAANALACVAAQAPDSALAVNDALVAARQDAAWKGFTDDDLVTLVSDAGVTAKGVPGCITGGRYDRWVAQATSRARAALPYPSPAALTTTPVVVVGTQQYTGAVDDATAFDALLTQVSAAITAAAQG